MRCSSPWNRKCINNADILDFCPCIALTLRDRTRIVERLVGTSTERRALSYLKKGVLSVETNDQGERYLLHQCAAFSHRQSEVKTFSNRKWKTGMLCSLSISRKCPPYCGGTGLPHNSLSDLLRYPTLRDCGSYHAKELKFHHPTTQSGRRCRSPGI